MTRTSAKLSGAVALLLLLVASCESGDQTPATQVIVAITSDIPIETQLSRIEVQVGRRDGKQIVSMQDFTLAALKPKSGQAMLPLTFSVVKNQESAFLLVVTGYGPLGAGGAEEKIVEQKAVATFRDGKSLLLKVFLGRICVNEFCGGDDGMVCYPVDKFEVKAGECGEITLLAQKDLPVIDLDLLPPFDVPPDGAVMPNLDAGAGDAARGGGDAGCFADGCSCEDASSCDDGRFCTVDLCDATEHTCKHQARACDDDANACTLPATCNEAKNTCEQKFDESSTSSAAHCASSASAKCNVCKGDATHSASCVDGACVLDCLSGRFDADGDAANGCECKRASTKDDADDQAVDANCDGADGELGGSTRFVYVTPSGAGKHDGTSPANAATVIEAFDIATGDASRRSLLLASGVYSTPAALSGPDSLFMFGGYAADFRSRAGSSELKATSSNALLVSSASTGVTIDSVNLTTASQVAAGASTHTLDVIGSKLTLRRMTILAGNGAPGADGAVGVAGAASASTGGNGSDAPSVGTGGAGGASGPGGNGGAGGSYSGTRNGVDGGAAAITGTGCGHGGSGGPYEAISCANGFFYAGDDGTVGETGCGGSSGSAGSGGSGAGSLDASGLWVGAVAKSGGPGGVGSPGGGGGGGGAASCSVGASGGGGGEGGNGGNGGAGGGPGGSGGASIAILAMSSTIDTTSVILQTGVGGAGGRGGNGGLGGSGAAGGAGGGGSTNSSGGTGVGGGAGAHGGQGGQGGRGGCGGGGAGGPSIAVFGSTMGTGVNLVGTAPNLVLGSGGAAGLACAAGGGSAGMAGVKGMQQGF